MATFYNQATLSYNGNVTLSNITSGEIVQVLSASKTAVSDQYFFGDTIAYIVNIVNSGVTPFTVTLTDDLGSYTSGALTLVPLTYVTGSLKYFENGSLRPTPVISSVSPLVVSGITVPAGGNATVVYEARVNVYAPLEAGASITNEAVISNSTISPISVEETVYAASEPELTISKSLCPATITENGRLTYTFVIQNSGNSAAVATDNVFVTDTFNPVLDSIVVTFNGDTWTEGVNYTYDTATGLFSTLAGQITVPAATYTRDPVTGAVIVEPGVSILTVTGTV